jgi:hypothetical protein
LTAKEGINAMRSEQLTVRVHRCDRDAAIPGHAPPLALGEPIRGMPTRAQVEEQH